MFEELGLSCSIFLFEWIVTLFSNVLELDISARIWDNYFFYGDYYLMKVCLAISLILEKQATGNEEKDGFEMLIILFKNVGKHIEAEQLFKTVDDIKLTEK